MLPPVMNTTANTSGKNEYWSQTDSDRISTIKKVFGGSHPLRNWGVPEEARTPAATPAGSRKSSSVSEVSAIPYGRSGHSSRKSSVADNKEAAQSAQPYGRSGHSSRKSSVADNKKSAHSAQPYGRC